MTGFATSHYILLIIVTFVASLLLEAMHLFLVANLVTVM